MKIVTNLNCMSCRHEQNSEGRIDTKEQKSKEDDAQGSPGFFLVEENLGGDGDVRSDRSNEADGDSDERGIASQDVADEETEASDDSGEEDDNGGGLLVAVLVGEARRIPLGERRKARVDILERSG